MPWLNPFDALLKSHFSRPLVLCLLLSATAGLLAQTAHPIVYGDHPDPSIIRVGDTYWTASTSGDWAPEFPLYRSTDLEHWTAAGAVFPHTPEWAAGSFWAPELVADNGRVLVYYVGRKRDGPLCVAVATADVAEGPYTDHGPIVCQADGSIDPSFVRDEHGQPFLIWKEDGNSIGKPTPIWAQPLTSDLLHVTGKMTQLLVNDPSSWEGGVVEGPYIFHHADRFYLFYAGNACCGSACNYAEGVARASKLFGPWEKDPANPIIRPNTVWKCPGHGTAVRTPAGKDYLLYHAYPAVGTVYLGRESVLDEIKWSPDGWPVINGGNGPRGGVRPGDILAYSPFHDDFNTRDLNSEWQWPIGHSPVYEVGNGRLSFKASAGKTPVFLARSPGAAEYSASVGVEESDGAEAGLGIVGDAQNLVVMTRNGHHVELVRTKEAGSEILWRADVSQTATLWFRLDSSGHAEATFSYSFDDKHWIAAPDVSLNTLPPWDQGLRVGLVATVPTGKRASFVHFELAAQH